MKQSFHELKQNVTGDFLKEKYESIFKINTSFVIKNDKISHFKVE